MTYTNGTWVVPPHPPNGASGVTDTGAWQANHAYTINQSFTYSGTRYLVTTAYTSGASFGSTDTSNAVTFGTATTVTSPDNSVLVGGTVSAPTLKVGNIAALQRARQAFALADTSRQYWWLLGDSVTEGTGCTTNWRDNNYGARALRLLQKQYMAAGVGGLGYVGTAGDGGALAGGDNGQSEQGSALWTNSASTQISGTEAPAGFTQLNTSTNETVTLTFYGTSVDVISFKYGAAQNISYTLDGGASNPVTIPSGSNSNVVAFSTTPAAAGTHTVVISPSAGGTLYIRGAMVYNGDEGKGIGLVHDGAYGSTTSTWVSNFGTATNIGYLQSLWPNPGLVSIFLGLNDYQNNVAPATVQSNLQTLINTVQAACTITPSILLVVPYQRGDVSSPTYPWSQYPPVYYALAAAASNIAVLDLNQRIPEPTPANNYAQGLVPSPGVHPSNGGHFYIAQSLAQALAPA